jgi:hypothetical protein
MEWALVNVGQRSYITCWLKTGYSGENMYLKERKYWEAGENCIN